MIIKFYGSSPPAPGELPAQTTARVAAAGKSGRKVKVTVSDTGSMLLKHETAGTLLMTIHISEESVIHKEKKGFLAVTALTEGTPVFYIFNPIQKTDLPMFEIIFERARTAAIEEKRRADEDAARESGAKMAPSDSIAEAIQNSSIQPLASRNGGSGGGGQMGRTGSNANRPVKIILRGDESDVFGSGGPIQEDGEPEEDITGPAASFFAGGDNGLPRQRKDSKSVRFLDEDAEGGTVVIGSRSRRFEVMYKGCQPSETKVGIHAIVRVYPQVNARGTPATLVVDEDQVALVDKTQKKLMRVLRPAITYWCMHPYNKKVLGFIACPEQGEPTCYIVQVAKKARNIAAALVASQPPPKQSQAAMAREMQEAGMESMSRIAWSMQDTQEDKRLRNEDSAANSGFNIEFASAYLGTLEISGDIQGDGLQHWLSTLAGSHPAVVPTSLKILWNGASGNLQVVDAATAELYVQEPLLCLRLISVVVSQGALKLFKGQSAGYDWERPILAITSHDKSDGKYFLHCFRPEGSAEDIQATLTTLVQDLLSARKGLGENPFAPTSKDRHTTPAIFQSKRIVRDTLIAERIIGTGQFGAVYLARIKEPNKSKPIQWYAVKMIRTNQPGLSDDVDFLHEAEAMCRFSHPNLVKLVGICVESVPFLVVLEFMAYGDLRQVVKSCKEKNVTLTYLEQLKLIVQVSRAMKYIADQRYVHMDVAARNCLLGGNNRVKICDFGLTKKLGDTEDFVKLTSSNKMPLKWMSVESMFQGIFTPKSDVWSFAIVVWEIFNYGDIPYGDLKGRELQERVKEGLRLTHTPDTPLEIQDMCKECWNKEWKMRRDFGYLTSRLEGFARKEREMNDKPLRDIGKCLNTLGKAREVYNVSQENEDPLFRLTNGL